MGFSAQSPRVQAKGFGTFNQFSTTTCSVMKSYLQLHVDYLYDLNQLDNI